MCTYVRIKVNIKPRSQRKKTLNPWFICVLWNYEAKMLYTASRTSVKRTFSSNTILCYGRVLERVHQGSPAVRALKINFVAPSCTDVGSIRCTGRQSPTLAECVTAARRPALSYRFTTKTPRNIQQNSWNTHQKQ